MKTLEDHAPTNVILKEPLHRKWLAERPGGD